jgi:hypothetical protein
MEMVDMVITNKNVFWSKIEKCKHLFPAAGFGKSMGFHPRVSRPDKTNPPPGADFSISPSRFNYDMQNILIRVSSWKKEHIKNMQVVMNECTW